MMCVCLRVCVHMHACMYVEGELEMGGEWREERMKVKIEGVGKEKGKGDGKIWIRQQEEQYITNKAERERANGERGKEDSLKRRKERWKMKIQRQIWKKKRDGKKEIKKLMGREGRREGKIDTLFQEVAGRKEWRRENREGHQLTLTRQTDGQTDEHKKIDNVCIYIYCWFPNKMIKFEPNIIKTLCCST